MKQNWKLWLFISAAILGLLFVLDARVNATATAPDKGALTYDVSAPVSPVLSVAVRDMVPSAPETFLSRETNPIQWLGDGVGKSGNNIGLDALVGVGTNDGVTPDPLVTFEGVPSLSGVTPPDTNGDVGPNNYIQMTNFHFQIWDKGDPANGIPPTVLAGPISAGTFFAPLGGGCGSDFGDPVVLYDDMADRWLLSQFNLSSLGMCIAISTSSDPLDTYYLYNIPTPDFPDYPKLGVWPDAYLMGTNTGFPNQYYAHAFDRQAMLAGAPATRQSVGNLANLPMPADVDGPVAPPVGEPAVFYTYYHPNGTGHPGGPERLAIFEYDLDWNNPGNSTFSTAAELPITPFNYTICGFFAGGCVEQPGTGQLLDDLAWWPMNRFQYRNFGSYATLVGNFTVDADGQDHAGIRWFEVRKSGSTYSLYQEGTLAPDTDSRWMGSIAMDLSGNIALGYSVSSGTTIPSIRYTTRLAGDPLGTLNAEAEMYPGGGVQTGIHRWGDYSTMSVDPVDGCTFWFTTEYHDTNDSGFGWNTRIGSFRIPSCGGPSGTLTGQVVDTSTSQGIPGAAVQATASITKTGYTLTDANGYYTMTLLEGSYYVTATAFAYLPDFTSGVGIVSGTVTTADFALDPAASVVVEGYVTDDLMDWPLYAQVDIGGGYPGDPVWTDPVSGYYSVTLPVGVYPFTVDAFVDGYTPQTTVVTVTSVLAPNAVASSPVNLPVNQTASSPQLTGPAGTLQGVDAPSAVLYDQTGSLGINSITSQEFEAAFVAFDNQGADDFVVPTGQEWTIDGIVVPGAYFNGFGLTPAVNVYFYSNSAGLPGSAVYTYDGITSFTDNGTGSLAIDLSSNPAVLSAGTYWVSVQADMDFGVGGQWGWTESTVQVGNPSAWQNPGNGFGTGCTTWANRTGCGVGSDPDLAFALTGVVSAYTFSANPNIAITDSTYIGVGDGNDGFGADAGMVCSAIDTSGTLPPGTTVDGVTLDLGATHTWIGDLTVKLQSPDGSILAILERPRGTGTNVADGDTGTGCCGDSSNLDGALLNFADTNTTDSDIMGGTITSSQFVCTTDGVCTYWPNPDQALVVGSSVANLASFVGQNASGVWTLCAADSVSGDTGNLVQWNLHLTVTPPASQNQTANFSLPADPVACTAPGYTFGTSGAYFEDFEANDGGYTVTGTASWAWGAPTSGPFSAHSGTNVWGTNLAGNYNDFEDTTLTSPVIDLSAFAGEAILVDWWQWAQTESGFDYITVDVSNNGGSSWTTVYGPLSGDIDLSWAEYSVLLDPSYAVNNFQVRFHFTSDVSVTYPGWYIDDISISSGACNPPASGGLVVGNVYDANTLAAVNGAWVTNETGSLGYAMETPLDDNVDDAFYTVYSLSGSQVHTATYTLYGEDVQSVGVVDFDTVAQDFFLPSGFVVANPDAFDVTLEIGGSTTLPLNLEDIGGANVEFEIREAPGTNPWGGIHIPASDGNFPRGTAAPSYLSAPNSKDASNAPKGLHPLKLLGGASAIGAEFFNLEFYGLTLADPGTLTAIGPLNDTQFFAGDFINGDFATLYTLDYGFNALYTVDTATGAYTQVGPSIPNGAEVWTGMAGDSTSGEMYATSTDCNSNTLYTVDLGTGAVSSIGSGTGFCIIGIAINSNGDLYGLDIIGDNLVSIDKATGAISVIGSVGFDANFAQGMDFDEDTDTLYLAAYNNASGTGELRVADVSTGNTTLIGTIGDGATEMDAFGIMAGGGGDVPWVSESPITGTVPANGSVNVDVTFDAAQVPVPGQYTAFLNIAVDTPQLELTVPLTLNVTCSTCGTLDGEITDEATGFPLVSTIHITSTGGFDFTIEDVTAYNVQLTPGEYFVNASATGYLSETATVDITTGNTTTQDFALWANTSILSFSPASVEESLNIGDMVTNTVTVTNTGAAPMDFEVNIGGYSGPMTLVPVSTQPLSIPASDGNFKRGTAPTSMGPVPGSEGNTYQGPTASLAELLGSSAYSIDHSNLFYTIFDTEVPEVLPNLGPMPTTGGFIGAGEYVNGLVYMIDTDNVMWEVDPATGAILNTYSATPLSGGETYTAMAYDPTSGVVYAGGSTCGTSSLYTIDAPSGAATLVGPMANGGCLVGLAADGDGNLWGYDIISDVFLWIDKTTGNATVIGSIGFDANFGQGMGWDPNTDTLYMAAFNNGTFLPELRAVDRVTGNTTLIGVLGQTDPGSLSQLPWLGFEISGGTGGWAYAVPEFGTVPPFSSTTFELVFDARSLYQTGDYYANLAFSGSFANDPATMPLTMHVSCPTCGFLAGDIYDAFTSAPVNADVFVSSEAGTAITLTGVASYSLALQPGSYDFLVTADGYFSETASVSVEAGQTVVTDFSLTPIVAIMEYSPFSFERTVALGQVLTDTLTLSNAGTVAYDFELSDVETGAPGALAAPQAGSILLVDDDDNGPDVQSYYTTVLDAMGLSYDIWDTGGTDTEPDEATLSAYSTVIWFTGVSFGGTAGPGSAGEAALSAWLDSGACFLISSQDYYYDRGLTSFMTDYLGVASATSDVGQTSVTGAGSLFAGLGPYTLSYPFFNYSDDLTPDGTAEVAFTGDSSPNAAINKTTSSYATTFLGYPFEAISNVSDQIDVMDAFLSSCLSDALWLAELPAIGTVAPDASESVGIIFDASVITQTGTYTAELRFDGNYDNSVSNAVVVMHVIESGEAGVTVGDSTGSGEVGTTVTHTMWITNTGNVADVFTLSVAGNTWNTEVSATTIVLNPGESAYVMCYVDVPVNAAEGDTDTATVTVTSSFDNTVADSATATTEAVVPEPPTIQIYLPIVNN